MIPLFLHAHFITDALRRRLDLGVGAPDPLDHPDLRRMSPREVADLPLPRPEPVAAKEDALGTGHDLAA